MLHCNCFLPCLVTDPALQWRMLKLADLGKQQMHTRKAHLRIWTLESLFLFCLYFKVLPVPVSAHDLSLEKHAYSNI